MKRICVVSVLLLLLAMSQGLFADALGDLARPQTGRSMRETSTHKTGPDGKYDPNGVKLGGVIDLYSAYILSREYHLLDFWPEKGKYTLRLECVGKTAASTGHYLGIESVRLRERRPRVKKYGHDAEKDWRKKPILYE